MLHTYNVYKGRRSIHKPFFDLEKSPMFDWRSGK